VKNLTRQHIQDWLRENKDNPQWKADFEKWLNEVVEGEGHPSRTKEKCVELILADLPTYETPNA
jgi:hypothetical protein